MKITINRKSLVPISDISNSFSKYFRKLKDQSEPLFIMKNNSIEAVMLNVEDYERLIEAQALFEELEPAYAITVHKSQGSEFPAVVLPIYPGPPMLMTRNLLYTAVTRAKSLVVIVGNEAVLESMVNNVRELKRYSGLKNKLIVFSE